MDDLQHMLGQFSEFKRWMEIEMTDLKRKVDDLNSFKWRVAGGAAVLSVILTAVVEAFVHR